MKHWKTLLPVVAVIGGIVAAVWHVRSLSSDQAAIQAATAVETTQVSSSGSTAPMSDRYSGNVGVAN